MNEKGYSWPEAILTLIIMMMVFGTLLPLTSTMTTNLDKKKMGMIASETALHGIILYGAHGMSNGVREVDNISYEWFYNGYEICVSYSSFGKVTEKCITP